MSLTSNLSEVDVPEGIGFAQFILKNCEKYADKVALVQEETGKEYTYRELAANIKKVARSLYKRGLKKGDVILVFSPNMIDYPVLFHGSALIGGTVSMCNPLYKQDELLHHMKDCKAKYVVTVETMYPIVEAALKEYNNVEEVFLFGPAAPGCTSFSDLLTVDDDSVLPQVDIDPKADVIAMPYSSGTTGLPKGVCITSYNFIACCQQLSHPAITGLGVSDNDVCLGVVPFYHILGIGIYMGYALQHGAKIIVMSRFNLETFIKGIEKHKVTCMHLVPPIIVIMAKHPLVEQTDTSSLQTLMVAGAPLGKAVTEQAMTKLGVKDIRQLYGMTECLATHCQRRDNVVPGSVGVICPNAEVKVVNVETGKICGANEDGELWLKGPGNMKCYHNKPEITSKTLDEEGYIHSGDIGRYDEQGNFWIVDRVKELIKYNAYQVAPAELENLLLSHPGVADAAVVGMPDEKAGELPRAYIVRKQTTQDLTEEEIVNFVEDKVAPYKKLRGGVEFRESIPKLPSGKILRRVLRQDAAEYVKSNNQ